MTRVPQKKKNGTWLLLRREDSARFFHFFPHIERPHTSRPGMVKAAATLFPLCLVSICRGPYLIGGLRLGPLLRSGSRKPTFAWRPRARERHRGVNTTHNNRKDTLRYEACFTHSTWRERRVGRAWSYVVSLMTIMSVMLDSETHNPLFSTCCCRWRGFVQSIVCCFFMRGRKGHGR